MRACFSKFRKIGSAKSAACQKKRETVFSWTLSFIWDKCAEMWWLPRKSFYGAWRSARTYPKVSLVHCSGLRPAVRQWNPPKNISPSSKSHICPFHTSDLWVDMLLLMCGHSKRFNHGLMHISEAWFCTHIQSLETHQRSLQSFSCKLVYDLSLR